MSNKKKSKLKIPDESFVYYPDELLRRPCVDVTEDDDIRKMVLDLRAACLKQQGVAVAGPQIGLNKNIFYYLLPDVGGERYEGVVINPKILEASDELSLFEEGCLSIPGYYWEVERPTDILLEWIDENGKDKQAIVNGLEGRVFQHEIDHLNGTLLVDYLSDADYDKFENDFFFLKKRAKRGAILR